MIVLKRTREKNEADKIFHRTGSRAESYKICALDVLSLWTLRYEQCAHRKTWKTHLSAWADKLGHRDIMVMRTCERGHCDRSVSVWNNELLITVSNSFYVTQLTESDRKQFGTKPRSPIEWFNFLLWRNDIVDRSPTIRQEWVASR